MTLESCGFDYSLFNPTQFKLVFNKIPNIEFFCQSINLPALSMNPVKQVTPFLDVNHPGEKIFHETLNVEILLDKAMKTYSEIYKWMWNNSVMGGAQSPFSDCTLIMGDAIFNFKDVLPIAIAPVNLSIAMSDIPPIVFGVTFEYDYFDMT